MSIIAVDFDGTLCANRWPEIGEANWEIIRALKRRQAGGDRAILWTCRSGKALEEAVAWCRERGLWFDAINENLRENIDRYDNDCRKIFAHEYWDDKSVMVRGGATPLMAQFQEDGRIRIRRWRAGTLAVQEESLFERIRRRLRAWRCD